MSDIPWLETAPQIYRKVNISLTEDYPPLFTNLVKQGIGGRKLTGTLVNGDFNKDIQIMLEKLERFCILGLPRVNSENPKKSKKYLRKISDGAISTYFGILFYFGEKPTIHIYKPWEYYTCNGSYWGIYLIKDKYSHSLVCAARLTGNIVLYPNVGRM